MAEYVSKNEVKPYRKIFDKMMVDIRESVRKKGITFTYQLVGSAKRNLVVSHHNKGFDCDYQIVIRKNKNNSFNKIIQQNYDIAAIEAELLGKYQ